jgi:hypothetical protein
MEQKLATNIAMFCSTSEGALKLLKIKSNSKSIQSSSKPNEKSVKVRIGEGRGGEGRGE